MPEEFDDLDEDEFDEDGNPNMALLRRRAKAGKAAGPQIRELKLQLAARDAQLDLTNPVATLFLENYKGDTTAEAILAAAKPYDIVLEEGSPPSPVPVPEPAPTGEPAPVALTPEEQRATDERREAATGGVPHSGEAPSEDPKVAAVKKAQDRVDAGATADEGLATVFGELFEAGVRGDERVIYSPQNP